MTVGGLEIGQKAPLAIREERLSARPDACRLLYVSDVHLRRGRSQCISQQVIAAASVCAPEAILLGGDLVDKGSELPGLRRLVQQLAQLAPVYGVGGNHDQGVGLQGVRESVVDGGGVWIHDDCVELRHGSRRIAISGPGYSEESTGDVRVLCAHNPRIWKTARRGGYDLVLAGHLHGCQFVAFEFRERLFPGAWFYPYNYLRHREGKTRLVVSRGVSDLVPIRWRCPREVVLCSL